MSLPLCSDDQLLHELTFDTTRSLTLRALSVDRGVGQRLQETNCSPFKRRPDQLVVVEELYLTRLKVAHLGTFYARGL